MALTTSKDSEIQIVYSTCFGEYILYLDKGTNVLRQKQQRMDNTPQEQAVSSPRYNSESGESSHCSINSNSSVLGNPCS